MEGGSNKTAAIKKNNGKEAKNSSSSDECSEGGSLPLKKGPWTSKEDEILAAYVIKNGEGNWNAIQKKTGLMRCGKSCRLRWANHLRPDLKKGPFTQEEERLIIEMHARMGNKWARMAAELPGRTDNEIKNYWNTRVKRLQRVGMPIYPNDMCHNFTSSDDQQFHYYTTVGDVSNHSVSDLSLPEIAVPDTGLGDLDLNQDMSPYFPTFLATQGTHFAANEMQVEYSYSYPSMFDYGHQPDTAVFPWVDFVDQGETMVGHIGSSSANPTSNTLENNNNNNNNDSNNNSCVELPSIQSAPTEMNNWATLAMNRHVPSVESDEYVVVRSSDNVVSPTSPKSSGLLEAVVHECSALAGASAMIDRELSSGFDDRMK